jgi:hypothetical protein
VSTTLWALVILGAVFLVPSALLGASGALWRAWKRLRSRRRRVPPRFPDGRPLTQPERERLDQIERGYGPAPRVLRRVR